MKYLKIALLLIVMLSELTIQVSAANITLTGALTLNQAREGYYTGSVSSYTNTISCSNPNCGGFAYIPDYFVSTGYCFSTDYLSDKSGRIIQTSNINKFSNGWRSATMTVDDYSYSYASNNISCRNCSRILGRSREAYNIHFTKRDISYKCFYWDSQWGTVTLKNCTTTGVTFSGAEVIIDGGRSPVWTGGLL